jgi:hypothetical protein
MFVSRREYNRRVREVVEDSLKVEGEDAAAAAAGSTD